MRNQLAIQGSIPRLVAKTAAPKKTKPGICRLPKSSGETSRTSVRRIPHWCA